MEKIFVGFQRKLLKKRLQNTNPRNDLGYKFTDLITKVRICWTYTRKHYEKVLCNAISVTKYVLFDNQKENNKLEKEKKEIENKNISNYDF